MNGFVRRLLVVTLVLALAAGPAAAQDTYTDADIVRGILVGLFAIGAAFFVILYVGPSILSAALPGSPTERVAVEKVEITLSEGRAAVRTTLTFANGGDREFNRRIYFPFGSRHGIGAAENATVADGAGNALPFEQNKEGLSFTVKIPPKAPTTIIVVYEQPLAGTTFAYVFPPDRKWGRTVNDFTATITIPAAMGRLTATYPLTAPAEPPAAATTYTMKRTNFDPRMNLRMSWTPP